MKKSYPLLIVILSSILFFACQNQEDKDKGQSQQTTIIQNEVEVEEQEENPQMAIDELEGELGKINDELEDIMLEMENEMEYEAETEMDSLS
jgi:hypothetical protein